MIVGYTRTSTLEQVAGIEAQLRDLTAAGVEKVFQEQVTSVAARAQLDVALEVGFDDGKVGARLIGLAKGEVALGIVGHAP
jgi:hypothetical protein